VAIIGRYQVLRKLGEGGMGSVLLANDDRGHSVVLKIPHHVTPEVVARMEDEARVGMQLRHPHIVKTLDFFMDGPRPVIVIGHIAGTSLRELRDTVGALPPAMVARVGEQISDALAALHHLKDNDGRSLEILHRDVTPGNILVDRSGNACLIDLGIARSVLSQSTKTAVGILRGTFRYISPDLFAGKAYSWMTDLWALGVTLFEASMGRKAVEGSEHQVFSAIMHGKLTTVADHEKLHPALRFLFDGLLEVDADARRFRDPEDVLHAFRVIRGRLGDGETDTIDVMSAVPIPMDEESMEATEHAAVQGSAHPAPVDLTDISVVSPNKAAPAHGGHGGGDADDDGADDFGEPTIMNGVEDRTNQSVAVDDFKTINTGNHIDDGAPRQAPRRTQAPPAALPSLEGARTITNPIVLMEDVDINFDED
jgi:serine/threonine-protein kinase